MPEELSKEVATTDSTGFEKKKKKKEKKKKVNLTKDGGVIKKIVTPGTGYVDIDLDAHKIVMKLRLLDLLYTYIMWEP